MHQIYYFAFVFWFIDTLQFAKSQACYEEVRINNIKVKWSSSKTSIPVVSDPPCVNKNNILVTRTCLSGKWYPTDSNECVSVQVPFRPDCLDHRHRKNNDGYCIYISERQPWTSETPVVDVEDIRQFLNDLYVYDVHKFWLPVNRTEKYGKYIWRIPMLFGEKFTDYQYEFYRETDDYSPDFVSRDCMVGEVEENGYKIEPEDCKAKHRTVHIYDPASRYFITGKNLTFSTGNNKAYFVEPRCQTLAQPKNKEDNFAIKRLVSDRNCTIGIERDKSGAFIWQNTSSFINYTDWIPSTNFSNSIVVVTKDGWKLEHSASAVTCSVCEIDHTTYKTEIMLHPNINHSQLIVTTYSAKQKMSRIIFHTTGLEDIDSYVDNIEYPIENNYSGVQNKLEKLDERRVWIVNLTNNVFNYYYFTAYLLPNAKEMKTNTIFLSSNNTGREYAFEIKIDKLCSRNIICDPHLIDFHTNISEFLLLQTSILSRQTIHVNSKLILNKLDHIVNITSFRAIKILKIEDKGDIKMLYHLRTNQTLENVTKEFNFVQNVLNELARRKLFYQHHKLSIKNDTLKSCMGCLPDSTKYGTKEINWEYTEIGQNSTPMKKCVQSEYLYTRKCGGDYLRGGKWEKPEVIFQNTNQFSKYTDHFCNLFVNHFKYSQTEVFHNLSKLSAQRMELKAADIYYVSEILKNAPAVKLPKEDRLSIARNFSFIIHNMIAVNKTSLEEANQATNSTNVLLATAEKRLLEYIEDDLDEQGVNEIVFDNYMIRISDPFVSGITGLALLSTRDDAPFSEYDIRNITADMSLDEILSWENLKSAIYVPEKLLADIKNYSLIHNTTVRISISFYYNDSLFIENKGNTTNQTSLNSRVFDVSIKGYDNYLYSWLPVITKLKTNSSDPTLCAYWAFGSQVNNLTAGWQKELNKDTIFIRHKNIQICKFKHLTNFAFLLGKKVGNLSNPEYGTITAAENRNLEIITAVGCVFSTAGICGIFLTAMVFQSWRQKVGSKVLLNVSTCILLQIILLYLNMKYTETICLITGTLLHYSILCGFSWSLIMAVLQYLRFVRVMGGPTSHLILKAALIGWIVPLFPVIAAVIVNQVNKNKYIANLKELGSNICYPQDLMLYLTLLLPVTLIVIANLVIFIIILYNISWRPKIINTSTGFTMQQFKLAILLFFLLGLTWIVGLISVVYHSIALLYFFSASATFQGFILFIFYIVLDQGTRSLWYAKLRPQTTPSKKMSQQTSNPNTYTFTKEESGTSLTEVADLNARVQAVMQNLNGTHRVGNGVRSRSTK